MFKKWRIKKERRRELSEFVDRTGRFAVDGVTGLAPIPEGWQWYIGEESQFTFCRPVVLYCPEGYVIDKTSCLSKSLLMAATSVVLQRYRTNEVAKGDSIEGYYPPKRLNRY